MKTKIIAILALITVQAVAQELPGASISINGNILPGFYKAEIHYGEANSDCLYIKWSHALEADTFWVSKPNASLEYITDTNARTVWYNQPLRYERRMAIHHLRERILNSPLKFDNLEDLAKNRNNPFLGKNLYEYFY